MFQKIKNLLVVNQVLILNLIIIYLVWYVVSLVIISLFVSLPFYLIEMYLEDFFWFRVVFPYTEFADDISDIVLYGTVPTYNKLSQLHLNTVYNIKNF